MTNPTHGEMLPCPFCGGKGLACIDAKDAWAVECDGACRCEGPPAHTEAKAIAAWNRRSALVSPEQTEGVVAWRPTEAQIKHMVERFLNWRLPENFNPDAGISFEPANTLFDLTHQCETATATIATMRAALEKAADTFALIAKEVLSLRKPDAADLAPAHSLAFCGEKDARTALKGSASLPVQPKEPSGPT